MMKQVLVGAALLAVVLSPLHGAAQSNPRIGTWKLNLAKARFEHGPAPKSETRTYTVWQGDGISVTADEIAASGVKQGRSASASR